MQNFTAKLKHAAQLTEDVFQYDFEFVGDPVPYLPGQFFILKVNDGLEPKVNRSYSISSAPSAEGFSFCVKLIPGGRASEVFRGLELGGTLEFSGSFGHFTLKDLQKDLVLVATGTGIAPYMGMLPVLFEQGFSQKVTLIFGVRKEEDLFYVDQLKAWADAHSNLELLVSLSQGSENWTGLRGRVTEHFEKLELNPKSTLVYICGNGAMVKEVKGLAEAKGFEKGSLFFELFTPI